MYAIEDRSLVFRNGVRYTFKDFIAEALAFDDVIVVRLENQGWERTNENVFAVDYKGRLLWQITKRLHAFAESSYVNIYSRNNQVDAYNWDGTILSLDPKTGVIMSESLVYSSSKHQTRKREFI